MTLRRGRGRKEHLLERSTLAVIASEHPHHNLAVAAASNHIRPPALHRQAGRVGVGLPHHRERHLNELCRQAAGSFIAWVGALVVGKEAFGG